ncbi:3-hydroxyacyl-CoA dehydrogenase [Azospirillum sp. TSH100]|uniref:3-hydroxyacyl-CoA dehydrogenase NAD-binding domain-containing protein n=1 Tax=Azospirillum sp. TSH100 TaxID=652764 RepID=UPI000D61943E|nr:3-hydroxyacyl-CoA dehydrogenase NAD-binding domain-containing protein [Azospirillum sp. TSH100]PWC90076.1 3-hydroxyacyl-CoA dehydrogenase [Azospirillum sp. TSH100]QCG90640.1 3-hydroxyacyl-CoA dehydrogenase [Azospirillum sp. TSH100]
MPPPSPTISVAVLGCGLIGESWSALFLAHGLDVAAWDPDGAVLAALPERVERLLGQLRALGTATTVPGRLSIAPTVAAAVAGAGWIQENAPEKTVVKHSLYAEVEAAAAADAVIASSTSSLTWTDLAAGVVRRDRLVTAHPFNPPHLMPLVELFAADARALARAQTFYRGLGRATVVLKKDAVGRIANRLASALWREAVNIVAEGIADVADVDAALVHGPGLRWSVIGAHMAYHLGGGPGGIAHYLDHLGPSQERRWATLGSPSLTPEVRQLLIDGIAQEASGRSVATLEAERDHGLILTLAARRNAKQGVDA